MIRVVFVCMGNICRSPTAHGVFRHKIEALGLADQVDVDSAGTHGFHLGSPPDRRAMATLADRGIDVADLRSRQITLSDFTIFDYVLAMDEANYRHLRSLAPESTKGRVHRLMDFAPEANTLEVPDPYYGGALGFEKVFELVDAGTEGFIRHLKARHRLR